MRIILHTIYILNFSCFQDYRIVIPFSLFPSSVITRPYTALDSLSNVPTSNIRSYTHILHKVGLITFFHFSKSSHILLYFLPTKHRNHSKQTVTITKHIITQIQKWQVHPHKKFYGVLCWPSPPGPGPCHGVCLISLMMFHWSELIFPFSKDTV